SGLSPGMTTRTYTETVTLQELQSLKRAFSWDDQAVLQLGIRIRRRCNPSSGLSPGMTGSIYSLLIFIIALQSLKRAFSWDDLEPRTPREPNTFVAIPQAGFLLG